MNEKYNYYLVNYRTEDGRVNDCYLETNASNINHPKNQKLLYQAVTKKMGSECIECSVLRAATKSEYKAHNNHYYLISYTTDSGKSGTLYLETDTIYIDTLANITKRNKALNKKLGSICVNSRVLRTATYEEYRSAQQ